MSFESECFKSQKQLTASVFTYSRSKVFAKNIKQQQQKPVGHLLEWDPHRSTNLAQQHTFYVLSLLSSIRTLSQHYCMQIIVGDCVCVCMVVCSVERLAPGTPTEQTSPAAHLPPLAQDVWPGNISGTNVVVNKCACVRMCT